MVSVCWKFISKTYLLSDEKGNNRQTGKAIMYKKVQKNNYDIVILTLYNNYVIMNLQKFGNIIMKWTANYMDLLR